MTARLRTAIPDEVRQICVRLAEAGFKSWVVGGCVRDRLLFDADAARESDWDIATSARPEQVVKLFRRVVPTGIKHGTVTVLGRRDAYEVTTLRGETTYSDGRRPDDVFYVDDIVADLARRDFTINAIAYDPLADQLIDPFHGIQDLSARKLRAVGDPHARFAEDGLRVLRAARFVATLEVEIEPETARAIEPSLDSYRKVSAERIRDEWLKAMKAARPSRAFEVMREHGLLAITAPELLESVGCTQNRHHAYDVWQHTLHCLDACPPVPLVRVAGLLHDVGKPRSRAFNEQTQDYTFYEHDRIGAEMSDRILERLRFGNQERERIVALVRHHLICYDSSWSDSAVRRWIRRVGADLLGDLQALGRADVLAKGLPADAGLAQLAELERRAERLLEQGTALTTRDLAVNGHDLMRELGLKPGPELGRILNALLDEVTEDPSKNTREALLGAARRLASGENA